MTQQLINTGTFANDATGDPAQVAFQKINNNFGQLFGTSSGVTFGPPPTPPGGTPVTILGAQPLNAPALVVQPSGTTGTLNVPVQQITAATTVGASNGLFILAGEGNAADRALDVLNQAGTQRLFGVFGDGSFQFGHSGLVSLSGSAAGNLTIAAPTSGTTLATLIAAPGNIVTARDTSNAFQLTLGDTASYAFLDASNATSGLALTTQGGGNARLQISNAGNVTINAPSSGAALTANGSEIINTGSLQVTGTGTGGFAGAGIELFCNGTTGSAQAFNRTSAAFIPLSISGSTVTLNYGASATPALSINSSGDVAISKPASGVALTVGDSTTAFTNAVMGLTNFSVGQVYSPNSSEIYTTGATNMNFGPSGTGVLNLFAAGRAVIQTLATGNVSINAPTNNAFSLSITAPQANIFSGGGVQIAAPNVAGVSNGMRIIAGTNSGDSQLVLTNAAQSVNYWTFAGDGGLFNGVNVDKGVGTINCAGLFVNGVAVVVP